MISTAYKRFRCSRPFKSSYLIVQLTRSLQWRFSLDPCARYCSHQVSSLCFLILDSFCSFFFPSQSIMISHLALIAEYKAAEWERVPQHDHIGCQACFMEMDCSPAHLRFSPRRCEAPLYWGFNVFWRLINKKQTTSKSEPICTQGRAEVIPNNSRSKPH